MYRMCLRLPLLPGTRPRSLEASRHKIWDVLMSFLFSLYVFFLNDSSYFIILFVLLLRSCLV